MRGLQLNVIAPVAGFPVGGHESAAQQGAQSQHKAVVEVLPGSIEGADRLGQQRLYLRFQPCVIAGEDGLLNGNRRGRRDQILQPLQNLLVIHQRNLPVGQGDLAHKIAAEGGRGFQCLQIAGHQQKTVNGGGIAFDLRIDHAGVDEGGEGLAVDQGGQTVINLLVRLGKHFPDNIVAAGGDPEGPRLALVAEVVDHRPRVENLRLAEAVAVVPPANFVVLIGSAVVFRHLHHLVGGEAEVGAVFVVQHGVDGQVVHPAEDALLCHPQNAGEEAEGQVLIILEPAGKQVPHKPDDLVVIVLLVALLDGGVVLVDDDNGRNGIVLVQHSGQVQQCRSQLYLADLAVCQLFIGLLAVLVALFTGQQLFVPPGLLCENIPDGRKGLLPSVELHILEGQEDHRVLALIIPVLLAAGPDLLIPEVDGGILVALFKISAQHIHIQRLAEAAGAGEQRHHRTLVDKVLDHHRLIDIVVFRRCKTVDGHADGQGQLRRALRLAESARLEPLIRRLLRISGDQPTIALLFRTGDSPILAERRNSPLRYIPAHCCLSYRDHFSHRGYIHA